VKLNHQLFQDNSERGRTADKKQDGDNENDPPSVKDFITFFHDLTLIIG
jgi:hypothetical protein